MKNESICDNRWLVVKTLASKIGPQVTVIREHLVALGYTDIPINSDEIIQELTEKSRNGQLTQAEINAKDALNIHYMFLKAKGITDKQIVEVWEYLQEG